MSETFYVRFSCRGYTAAEWVAMSAPQNILNDREIGLETDTDKFKFGDGVTEWDSLPYIGPMLGAGVADFLATPTSANLRTAVTDETGSGPLVFGTSPNITTPTGIVKGDVGLGSVDNTSDANKPVSTAQQTALNLKANLSGGAAFVGVVSVSSTFSALAGAFGVDTDGVVLLPHALASGFSYLRAPSGRGLRIQSGTTLLISIPPSTASTLVLGYAGLQIGDTSGGGTSIYLNSIGASDLNLRAGDGNALRTADVIISVKNNVEVARFTDTGRFGVGTNAPEQAAHIVGAIKQNGYTVAGLAGLPTPSAGTRSFATDSTVTLTAGIGAVVAGGGANFVPVHHDGTNWRIG